MYNRSSVVKIILCCAFVLHVVVSVVIDIVNERGLKQKHKIQPGTPHGCSFAPLKTFWTAFIMDFVFDALVFVLAVYKAWQLRNESFTPLVNYLMHASTAYFVAMTSALVISTAVAFYPIGRVFGPSGVTLAVTSVLCSRMLLSLHHHLVSTHDTFVPMDELSLAIDRRTPKGRHERATTTTIYFASTGTRFPDG